NGCRQEIYNRFDTSAFEFLDDLFPKYFEFFNSYEKLLMTMFGRERVSRIIDEEIGKVASTKQEQIRVKAFFETKVFARVVFRIISGELCYPVSPAEENFIDEALRTLTPREQKVIKMRFGLDCENLTLEQVAKRFDVTGELIRQIEGKALRKLRHPRYNQGIKDSIRRPMKDRLFEALGCLSALCAPQANISDQAQLLKDVPYVRNLIETFTAQVERLKAENVELRLNQKEKAPVARYDLLDLSIHEMEISVRAYNCLCDAGLMTVRAITSKTREEILGINNLGKKSFTEIHAFLQENGLDFAV
ncbi:MAG: hypothetical protein E6R05_06325, partial [Candidatus Moraniibacteriota bacterium]